MQILVNGKVATIKKGSSFEFVSENRFFTDSDGYSFSISFPLVGCVENIAIFGHLNRADIDKTQVIFDCEISDAYFYRTGIITITEISNSEVKAQFLEGRSASNYDETFDDIYINELNLGYAEITNPPSDMAEMWRPYPEKDYVALPWISESGNLFNEVNYSNGKYEFTYSISNYISVQPYMLSIVKRIFDAVGYSYDLSNWENSMAKYILICNSIPFGYDYQKFADVLPHWSVTEFIEEIEKLLDCEFAINHKNKHISMEFRENIVDRMQEVELKKIVDIYTSELSQENIVDYDGDVCYIYKPRGDSLWNVEDCPWYIDYLHNLPPMSWLRDPIDEFETFDELLAEVSKTKTIEYNGPITFVNEKVYYAKDIDQYYTLKVFYREKLTNPDRILWHFSLVPINTFGNIHITEVNEDFVTTEEIKIVPVRIESTLIQTELGGVESDKGRCMYLPYQGSDSGTTSASEPELYIYQQIKGGEAETRKAAYDTIFIGFWDGNILDTYPYPYLDRITIGESWKIYINDFPNLNPKKRGSAKISIDAKQKYEFSFLTNEIPNVRSVFYINGKKYLCEKITATFAENGMSELKKGVFYRIVD